MKRFVVTSTGRVTVKKKSHGGRECEYNRRDR